MFKINEAKMKKEFDKICGNACNEMGDVTYTELSNFITEKIKSMGKENAEWVKVQLQRKKERAKTWQTLCVGISVPLTVLLYTPLFSTTSEPATYSMYIDIASKIIFLVLLAILGIPMIINRKNEESYRELYDLTEKAIQETYHINQ